VNRSVRTVHRCATIVLALLCSIPPAAASDPEPSPLDVESWHRMRGYYSRSESEGNAPAWAIGLYPGLSLDLGLPDGAALAGELYLSLTDARTFSAFIGYGRTHGPSSESHTVTVGWGGVRPLPVAGRQLGFYGTFLRYHRLDHDRHGRHQGLSVGTEFGAGHLALAFEGGAARSSRNHYAVIARVGLKVALPMHFPL
jgi:hypothetical protein